MEMTFLLANDLVDGRHWVAIDRKAADGEMAAVRHEPLDGALQGHDLVGVGIHGAYLSSRHSPKQQRD